VAAFGLKLSSDGDVLVWNTPKPGGVEVYAQRQSTGKTLVLRDLPKEQWARRWLDNLDCVSPDGHWLILPTEQGCMRRWDLTTGKELAPLGEALRTAWEPIWSPDCRYVAVRGSSSPPNVLDREARRDVRVWDVTTGARLSRLSLNDRGGRYLFLHDGRMLISTDMRGVIHLREVATGQERCRLAGHLPREVPALALSRDGRMLVSGGYDSQALVWDLTGRMPEGRWQTARLRHEQQQAAWKALAATDAKAAYAALWQLASDPEGTTTLLAERLRPIARPEVGHVARLIAALDATEFEERQRASNELESLGEVAANELRQTLTRKPSLEVRRRVEALLDVLDRPPTGERLRTLRALEVLERIGTPEARQLLKKLATGVPEARATQDAEASLRRLKERADGKP
jgi:hypothetical protein